jgi:uncharacterized protein (TIRG00374 family)
LSGGKKYWVGFGIGAGLLALFFVTGDWQRLGDALAQANYWYIIPAILLYQMSVVFRTMRWQVLLRHIQPIPVSRLFPVVVIGYMANNLLPMRIGELVRSYYLSDREQVSKTSAFVTIVIERLLDALTLLVFIAVIAIFVPLLVIVEGFGESSRVPWPALVAGISLPFILAFGGLMLAAYRPARAAALGGALITPLPRAVADRLRPLIDLVIQGLAVLGSPRTVLGMFLLSMPIWLLEAGLFFVLGYSFGLENAYDSIFEMAVAMVLVTAISNIGSSIPAAPGGIGLFELVARETLVLLPLAVIDRSTATAYVTVVHAVLLLPMIVLGQVFLLSGSVSLRRLWQAGGSLTTESETSHTDTSDIEAPL